MFTVNSNGTGLMPYEYLFRLPFFTWVKEAFVTHHNKTGQLSDTKKNVIFLLCERAFY